MSTQKIQLPDFVIADLYTDNLVIGKDLQVTPQALIATEKSIKQEIFASISETKLVVPKPIVANIINHIEKTNSKPKDPITVDTEIKWFLGNNGKQITVVIKESGVAFINDRHLEFLSNILNACKLNLGDIALVNYENHPYSYADLKQKLHPKYWIFFDVSTKEIQLPFTIPNYQVQGYDQSQILLAASLLKMDNGTQEAKMEKSKLWASLKNMFQL